MNPIEKLTEMFEKFPGIGPRQARHFVQYLLAAQPSTRGALAEMIRHVGTDASQCKKCFRYALKEEERDGLCSMCHSKTREQGVLSVVEKDADLEQVERSGYKGLYFVLGGTIPLAAEEPQKHVRMKELIKRAEADGSEKVLKEIILGLSATTEGDHTRLLLQEKLMPVAEGLGFKLSSLGRGLSTGSELEYADPDTIGQALANRN